jgi:hypothetical protein
MMVEDDDDRYRDDPEGFRRLDPDEYAALNDDEAWQYLRAWTDADLRRTARSHREVSRTNAPGRVAGGEVEG